STQFHSIPLDAGVCTPSENNLTNGVDVWFESCVTRLSTRAEIPPPRKENAEKRKAETLKFIPPKTDMSQTTIKSNADLHNVVKSFYETHATALKGIIDKLPENLRAELAGLRDSLSTSLAKLPPLDQLPAAQHAAWAFNSFADAIVRMQEYANGLLEKMNGLKTELSAKALALNGLEDKITKGELLDKTKVKEACDIARNEGAASMKPEIVATRKSALELAGLPVPGEDVLGLPGDQ